MTFHARIKLSSGHQPPSYSPEPSSSQTLLLLLSQTEKPKAEVWHFLLKLPPPFRREPAFSLTQVASFLLNNGVPYDECLNNTPTPLTSEVSGDKSHLVAMPYWSKLLWYRLGHIQPTLPHPGTTPHWPKTGLQQLPSEG